MKITATIRKTFAYANKDELEAGIVGPYAVSDDSPSKATDNREEQTPKRNADYTASSKSHASRVPASVRKLQEQTEPGEDDTDGDDKTNGDSLPMAEKNHPASEIIITEKGDIVDEGIRDDLPR